MNYEDSERTATEPGTDLPQGDQQTAGGARAESCGVDRSRRRFTRLGISGSVLMTLASRPALANQCTTSGMMSGNTSVALGEALQCEGYSADYWRDNILEQHANRTFGQVFNTACAPPRLMNATLSEVLDPANDFSSLAREAVAAVLNANHFERSGQQEVFGYSTSEIRTMVSEKSCSSIGRMELRADLPILNGRSGV